MSDKPLPNQEQVRLIFKETYLLYVKYINSESINWDAFHKEYVELCNKYPFDLNIQIITELLEIIGAEKGGIEENE